MTDTSPSAVVARRLVAQTPRQIATQALVLTLVLGAADVATGSELSFSIFYLLPITLVAWGMELRWALGNALLASVIWFLADRWAGHEYTNALMPYWNASIRLGYFVLFAVLFSRLRKSLDTERHLSRRDPLTGTFNRRAFEEFYELELERSVRYRRPMSLVFMDLDNFKEVNDRLGHDIGDALLHVVASTMVATLRSTDVVARLGGDEFAIVMPETAEDQALAALEKTRAALIDRMGDHQWPVTFSMGVVSTAGETRDMAALLARADDLMYQAKRRGRDRVVVGRLDDQVG